MKKLFFGALMAATVYGYGQSYFSVSVGYGLGVPGMSDSEVDLDTNYEGSFIAKNVNMGGGMHASISYGVELSENLHLDLAFGYQNNLGYTIEDHTYDYVWDPSSPPVWVPETTTYITKTSSFRFAPSLRFSGGDGAVRPFAKVGPQIILASMKNEIEETGGGESMQWAVEYSRNVSVGAIAEVGAQFDVNDNMLFFASVCANLGFYSPSSAELTTYKVDGADMLGQLDKADKEVEFEKELMTNQFNGSPDQPSKELRTRYDFSSIGINVGIIILL